MKIKGLSQLFSQPASTETPRSTQESASEPQKAAAQEAVRYETQRTPKEQQKIDDLKARVSSGEYKVDSTKVAQSIVKFYKGA